MIIACEQTASSVPVNPDMSILRRMVRDISNYTNDSKDLDSTIHHIEQLFTKTFEIIKANEAVLKNVHNSSYVVDTGLHIYENIIPSSIQYVIPRITGCFNNLQSAIDTIRESIPGLIVDVDTIFYHSADKLGSSDYHPPMPFSVDVNVAPEFKKIISTGFDIDIDNDDFVKYIILGYPIFKGENFDMGYIHELSDELTQYVSSCDTSAHYMGIFNARANIYKSMTRFKSMINDKLGFQNGDNSDKLANWCFDTYHAIYTLIQQVLTILCRGFLNITEACEIIMSYKYSKAERNELLWQNMKK